MECEDWYFVGVNKDCGLKEQRVLRSLFWGGEAIEEALRVTRAFRARKGWAWTRAFNRN